MNNHIDFFIAEIFNTCQQAIEATSTPSSSPESQVSSLDYEEEFKNYIHFSNSFFSGKPTTQQRKEIVNRKPEHKETKKKVWDEESDKLLLFYVQKYKYDWKKICGRMKKLTKLHLKPSALRTRYFSLKNGTEIIQTKFVLGRVKAANFSENEDLNLIQCVEELGLNWDAIAKVMPSRDAISLKNRFYYIKKTHKYVFGSGNLLGVGESEAVYN